MASSTLANSLISPLINSHSHISNRTSTPLRLPFPRINRSPILSLKTKTTHLVKCSGDDASAPKDETPIELRYAAYPTVLDINQIREVLPHSQTARLISRPSPSPWVKIHNG
ncbi:hypothetical protein Tco_1344637 [Tanacetum coccineum]